MARREDGGGYDRYGGDIEPLLIQPEDLPVITPTGSSQVDQVTPEQIVADRNNYPLPQAEMIRISTDASRTITGFAGSSAKLIRIYNVGTQNVVIAHDSASSSAENRVLCFGSVNITVGANGMLLLEYDFQSFRWRAR